MALGVVAHRQAGYWRDELTLYERVLAVTKDNFIIQNNYGAALGARGRIVEAVPHLNEALRLRPDYIAAANNLSYALGLLEQGGATYSLSRDTLADAYYRWGCSSWREATPVAPRSG